MAPNLSFSFQHNLLRGFGMAVNARNITVAKINLSTSDLNFKSQVIRTVVQVLNAYYALVAGYEDIKARQSTLQLAQTLYEDNQKQVQAGTLIPLDVTRAEAQLANTQRDLLTSQTNLQQQELQLKNLISRTGVAEPALQNARIVPLDNIAIPDRDDLASLPELVQRALANRSDIAAEQAGLRTAEVSALGTKNGILPSAQVFGGASDAGLAGTPHTVIASRGEQRPDPYFIGGTGTALRQIFGRNFPTQRIGAFFSTQLGNRVAQADYGIDQLQLRQRQVTMQKDINQVAVDVANSVVALQQARARYDAALKNRGLEEQLLAAEQKKYSLGASIPYNVIQQQRDLATAQSSEIASLVSYNNARIALDQTLGTILEANRVSITEAQTGRVARTSSLPAALPQQP